MPTPAWPTLLPGPTIDFGIELENSKLRTPMESGRYRERERFTRENRMLPVSWEMDDNEFAYFQSFYLYKLAGGSDFFTVDLPMGGEVRNFTVRFADNWKAKYFPVNNWKVSATLELEDARVLSEADFDTLTGLGSLATLPSYIS